MLHLGDLLSDLQPLSNVLAAITVVGRVDLVIDFQEDSSNKFVLLAVQGDSHDRDQAGFLVDLLIRLDSRRIRQDGQALRGKGPTRNMVGRAVDVQAVLLEKFELGADLRPLLPKGGGDASSGCVSLVQKTKSL